MQFCSRYEDCSYTNNINQAFGYRGSLDISYDIDGHFIPDIGNTFTAKYATIMTVPFTGLYVFSMVSIYQYILSSNPYIKGSPFSILCLHCRVVTIVAS